MDTINKSQAIEAMLEGKKVRHRHFSDNEWMTMVDPCTILLEDGVKCHPLDFWANRTGPAWEADWTIVSDKSEKEQKPDFGYIITQLGFMESNNLTMTDVSWGLQEGVLVSGHDAEHLLSLRQENQRLREALEKQWIPVSERLPDRIGDVLIRTDAGFHHVVYFNTKKQFLYKDGKAYRVVTHWQALQNTKGE